MTLLCIRARLHPDKFLSSSAGVIRAERDDGVVHRFGRVHMGLAANQGESLFAAHSQPMRGPV
jgi:hypothetical protein